MQILRCPHLPVRILAPPPPSKSSIVLFVSGHRVSRRRSQKSAKRNHVIEENAPRVQKPMGFQRFCKNLCVFDDFSAQMCKNLWVFEHRRASMLKNQCVFAHRIRKIFGPPMQNAAFS